MPPASSLGDGGHRSEAMTHSTDHRGHELIAAARAEAIFTSTVPLGAQLTREQATVLIRRAVRVHGGTRACAAEVAGAYGEHPETAALRMRWARGMVEALYVRRTP